MFESVRRLAVLWTRPAFSAILVSALPLTGAALAQDADRGQQAFQAMCSACHTIGGGRLVGPDLQGIAERRSESWIIDFVQHSQDLVQAGDADAVAIFEEYNRIPMPDQPLTDEEVRGVLEYIAGTTTGGEAPATLAEATDEQVVLGRRLFQGNARFTNNGPTCNSCHDVRSEAVIPGGLLAAELTDVISRVSAPGVWAILRNPPFPVMQKAYQDRPLTDDEIAALVGFLERADAEQDLYQPRAYGLALLGAGIVGTTVLLGLYTMLWRRRRKGTVHQAMFDRQVTSS
jgi:mono/diheme cytochrome c family protein